MATSSSSMAVKKIHPKKFALWIGLTSVVMLFAGFTSAYLVMMGDSFWLKSPMPNGFWISTVIILLSSLTFILAIRNVKKDNQKGLKLYMALTLLLGIAFMFFQFKGYGELVDRGIQPVNNHVVVTDGRYGDYFEVKYKDAFIEVDGNTFKWKGKVLTQNQMKEYQKFMSQFLTFVEDKPFKVSNYGNPFVLYFQQTPVSYTNERLVKEDGEVLIFTDRLRLHQLALNVRDARGDFFARGELGKDFHIYYKGKALEYKNRTLMWEGKKLDNYLQLKATETADTASSFLFIITILHLAHVFVTLFYLLIITIRSFSGRFTSGEHMSLITGSIFWHFLGLLWVYLFLFLVFIH